MISSSQAGSLAPEETARQYAQAIIANDINLIGRLSGMDTASGSALEQLWGKALAGAAGTLAASKAYDPADYRIQTRVLSVSAQAATVQLDIFAKNMEGIMERVQIMMGDRRTADGRLVPPENGEPTMSFSEALKRVEAENKVAPFHYRLPLHLVKKNGRWLVKYDQQSEGLIPLLRLTYLSHEHQQYLVK